MDYGVIRSKSELEALFQRLKERRLPFKIATQDIYPIRTIDTNDYLWGFVYTPIAEATGQTPQEVHEAMKLKYNFGYDLYYDKKTKSMKWVMAAKSTTRLDWVTVWDYIMKVRAEAEIDLHLTIKMPNEVFVNEVNFQDEQRFQTRRI